MHEVAFVELHESVEDCPGVIDAGDAEMEAVGAGAVTVTVDDFASRLIALL